MPKKKLKNAQSNEIHAAAQTMGEMKKSKKEIQAAAQTIGRLGGLAKSERKADAVRLNGYLGGRPRKDGKPPQRRKPLPIAVIQKMIHEAVAQQPEAVAETVQALLKQVG